MKISIVTPSFNQVKFLESTIRSVLSQSGVDLEYIIVDGGSTDGSKEVVEKYHDQLAWSCSEPDAGQYAAVNKGFEHATGDIMAWLNSSDIYFPWSLKTVANVFASVPSVDWVAATHKVCIGENNEFAGYQKVPGYSRNAFLLGMHGSREKPNFIQQESCFWRRSLWEKIGGKIPGRYKYAADFHLWALMFEHAALTGVECPLAGFRFHDNQRSKIEGYMDETEEILAELRRESRTPAHHNMMPITYLKPPGATDAGFGEWVLNLSGNDNFIFEVDDAETALQKKEECIQNLNKACIERSRTIERLKKESNMGFQLKRLVRNLFKR